jgi:hypothetical protein
MKSTKEQILDLLNLLGEGQPQKTGNFIEYEFNPSHIVIEHDNGAREVREDVGITTFIVGVNNDHLSFETYYGVNNRLKYIPDNTFSIRRIKKKFFINNSERGKYHDDYILVELKRDFFAKGSNLGYYIPIERENDNVYDYEENSLEGNFKKARMKLIHFNDFKEESFSNKKNIEFSLDESTPFKASMYEESLREHEYLTANEYIKSEYSIYEIFKSYSDKALISIYSSVPGNVRIKISRDGVALFDVYGRCINLEVNDEYVNFLIIENRTNKNFICSFLLQPEEMPPWIKDLTEEKVDSEQILINNAFKEFREEIDKEIISQLYNKKENKMNKALNAFMPSSIPSGTIALTMNGTIAVKAVDESYVSFDKETKTLVNHMNLVFGQDKLHEFSAVMPVNKEQVKIGDILHTGLGWAFVSDIVSGEDGITSLKVVNINTGNEESQVDTKNAFINAPTVKKLITFFGDSFSGGMDNPNGFNPLMFLMMGDSKGDKNDMFKMMMFSQMMGNGNQSGNGFNPLMMMMFMDK